MLKSGMKWLAGLLSLSLLAGLAALWWLHQPLETGAGQPTLDLSIDPGTTPRSVAQATKPYRPRSRP